MPQITVNEIDQSVVTRVVSDDRVKILIPAILSFGPGYDGETSSVMTFTDLSDFNRGCGYTPAEFNPFKNDYSRTYARELMKKGAAVSVVRINNGGSSAEFNIDGTSEDRTNPAYTTICKAAMPGISNADTKSAKINQAMSATFTLTFDGTAGNIIPKTIKIVSGEGSQYAEYFDDGNGAIYKSGDTSTKIADINYDSGYVSGCTVTGVTATVTYKLIEDTNCWKYTFCPQIQSITAKYPGSFGNNLFISISQINTNRLAESYQYANISVYYIDRDINYAYDETTHTSKIVSQRVKSVTLLENKRVSTNPDDPTYFEDVEFDFIKIIGTESAREDLSLVWSNISGGPTTNNRYSGFPVIPLRFAGANQINTYNFDANFDKVFGTDFNYSPELINKLKCGFKGFIPGNSSTAYNWTQEDVNKYVKEVYGYGDDPGIYANTISSLINIYQNFTDPYIYDFDFITSGGFVYQTYTTENIGTKISGEAVTVTEGSATLANAKVVSGSLVITGKLSDVNTTFYTEASATTGTDNIYYLGASDVHTVAGTIELTSGEITVTDANATLTTADYTSLAIENFVPVETYATTDPKIYPDVTPIHAAMINLVETRQDCIALFDVDADYDKKAIVEYSRILNTSYGTMHFPWCWVADPDVQGNMLLMAPSYIFMYTFLSNLDNNVDSQKWFPPAGVKRATARVVKKPYFEIGSVVLNDWQNDNTARVNPIMKLKQYGYVIYGQYTCLPAIDMFTHSALESLNVRLIANVVKKKIFDVCLNLAFEPNTSVLWLKFFAQMDEFLRYMQYNEGVYAYKIVMDESTVTTDDINHLRCPGKVYIAPTRTAEFFDIDFIITEAGALFNN